jgi:phage I-like protein
MNSEHKLENRTILAGADLPSDGWHMVAIHGEHPITVYDGKKRQTLVQVVDQAATAAMANRFNQARTANPALQLLVDFDHFSDNSDKSSEAAGWITELQNRDDGLWARIDWSDTGSAAVKGRRFRFLSPVWNREDCEDLGQGRIRPLRLDEVAVTNKPNIKGLRPLINRQTAPADNGAPETEKENDRMRNKLIPILALAADAGDDAVLAAVMALANQAAAGEKAIGTLTNRVKELEKAELDAQVEKDLDEHKAVIQNRDDIKAQLLANREGTLKVLKALKPAAEPKPGDDQIRLSNRTAGQPGTPDDKAKARNAEQEKAIEEVKIKNRCRTNAEAYAMATSMHPELFSNTEKK